MTRVLWTPAAEQDLMDIWLHIAVDDPRAADALVDAIAERAELLATFPEAGPIRHDISAEARMLALGNYVILYRLAAGTAEIIRVVHGARDPTTLL